MVAIPEYSVCINSAVALIPRRFLSFITPLGHSWLPFRGQTISRLRYLFSVQCSSESVKKEFFSTRGTPYVLMVDSPAGTPTLRRTSVPSATSLPRLQHPRPQTLPYPPTPFPTQNNITHAYLHLQSIVTCY